VPLAVPDVPLPEAPLVPEGDAPGVTEPLGLVSAPLPVELGAVPEAPVLVPLFEGDPSMMVLNEFPVVAGFSTFAPGF
jgi:hypothetical protein